MQMNRRQALKLGAASLASVMVPSWAGAQSGYPDKPIKLVVPFPAGGVNDVVARPWAEKVANTLGRVTIENVGGAGGSLGAQNVLRAPADGYTLLFGSGATHIVVPFASARTTYDPEKAFEPISILQVSGIGIAVAANHPAKTLQELIEDARKRPGELSYGSAGIGSATHLGAELFKSLTKTDIRHVPYRGGAPALADLVAGHVPVGMVNVSTQALELHRTGQIRLLAVTTARRPTGASWLPTAEEAGVPGCVAINFGGIFAPAGVPREVIEKVSKATQDVMKDKQFKDLLIASGFEIHPDNSPEEARRFVAAEIKRWVPVIKQIGLKIE
jgi:tripartite-type tricarboxylate transporter receptor subunit TctC